MKKILEIKKEEFIEKAISLIEPSNILLDIGCGIVPHDYIHHNVYIACEPFKEYVNVLKNNRKKLTQPIYLDSCFIIINEDWQSFLDKYEDYAVDTVYLIDVIEHLPKEQGMELLKRTEKIAKNQIVIFTPLEHIEQKCLDGNKDAWGLNGAEWQEHKSVWTPDDFDGDEWSFVVCKDYHQCNNIGEKLKKPVGAFWAIKNVQKAVDKIDILEHQEIKNDYKSRLKENLNDKTQFLNNFQNIVQENKNMEKVIEEQSKVIKQQLFELDSIKNSRGYRLVLKYRQWRDKLKGRI
jgi:hypothetical protein